MESNGTVVKGDLEYDGRVILYIIKGKLTLEIPAYVHLEDSLIHGKPIRRVILITSSR